MSDPISSKGWTGDTEARAAERRFLVRTHRLGEPAYVSDFNRFAGAEERAREVPAELRNLLRRAFLALLSPLLLFCAWLAVQMTTRDLIGEDNKAYLLVWGFGIAALALAQIVSRSTALIELRKALMALTIAGTVVVSGGYIYIASASRANALASRPERTFELSRSVGSRSFRRTEVTYQRADGTLLEGGYTPPVDWAYECTLAQRLRGDYGFTWVRVLERSRSSRRGELYWPIRREECFSDTPLELLPR